MELFYAGGPSKKIFIKFYELTSKKVNILKNFYELRDSDFKKEIQSYQPYVDKIMLDSGAFSVNNSPDPEQAEIIKARFPIFLEQNADFLKENIYRVFTYDYRFDQKDYLDNFIIYTDLQEAYNEICPVIHRYTQLGENIEVDVYSPYNPPTIAIGQILSNDKKGNKGKNDNRANKKNRPKLQETINSIKYSNSDCHLLGISAFESLDNLIGYDTCDSKSWMDNAKTGVVYIFWEPDNTNSEPISINAKFPQMLKDAESTRAFYNLEDSYQTRFFDEMKDILKLDDKDFNNSSSTESLMLANLYYFTKMVEYLNNKSSQAPIPRTKEEKPATVIKQSTQINQNPFATPKKLKK